MNLSCNNIKKCYGTSVALKNISYEFTPGVYGLLGPNGAGKSTLMNILTTSLKPTEGEIVCDGNIISGSKEEYIGKIGYVPQNQNLFSYFSGYKFMFYMATLKGIRKEEARKQIPILLEKVNMRSVAKNKISTYSGGMKQRLLIAQAFLGNPEFILMDEPTAGLDPKERIRIRNLISELSTGKIILIATHVVTDIEYISKEVLMIKKGEIICSGKPEMLENQLSGMVYEKEISENALDEFSKECLIAGVCKEKDKLLVRYIHFGEEEKTNKVRPTLDDVYLYHFREEGV